LYHFRDMYHQLFPKIERGHVTLCVCACVSVLQTVCVAVIGVRNASISLLSRRIPDLPSKRKRGPNQKLLLNVLHQLKTTSNQ